MAGFRSQIAFLSAGFILKKFSLLGGGLLGSEPAGKERLLCKDANEVSQLLFVRFGCEARLWTTPRGEGEWGSRLPFPSPGDLPDPGIEPRLWADSLLSEPMARTAIKS